MMKKKISEEEKQFQTKKHQEKELQTLIRQYFVLDKHSRYGQFAGSPFLERLSRVIRLFKQEHYHILTDLSRATDPGRIRDDEKRLDEISKLMEQRTEYEDRIKQFKIFMQELDNEMKLKNKIVHELQEKQTTDRQHEERIKNARNTVDALENKLETQMIQFGTICMKNKQLREEIDHRLSFRQTFMKQWNDLTEKLSEGKKIMLDLIEQATLAYNQREEWCTKLNYLRVRGLHSLNNNIQEISNHKRILDNNLKLREFFWLKSQKRVTKDLEMKEYQKRKIYESNLREKLDTYQTMLQNIEDFSHESKIRQIAQNFKKAEELNMSHFHQVINIIKESEEINARLGNLYLEIDERYLLHDSRSLKQKGTIEELEFDLEDYIAEAKASHQQLEETEANCNELLQGILQLFKICKCDKDPLLKLLGHNQTVQYHNVLLYLGVLERTIQDLLVGAAYIADSKKTDDRKKLISTTPEIGTLYKIDDIIKATPCSLCVEHEMVSDVIDVLQHVYSKPETKTKLKSRLKLPGGKAKLHTISHCQLPKARKLIQRRYE